MIMETKEFQFKGLTLSGFAMLFLNILLTVLSAVMVVAGFVWCQHELLAGLLIGVGFALLAVTLFVWGGFVMVEPGEARVMMFFGKYKGTYTNWATHGLTPLLTPRNCRFVLATLTPSLSR